MSECCSMSKRSLWYSHLSMRKFHLLIILVMTKFWACEVNLFNPFCQLNSISNSKYKYSCLEKKKKRKKREHYRQTSSKASFKLF